ncbi:MAG: HAMP domain-containing histidine kinase [Oscillospiraceae bacterium]|nr:HAMP domain-containing histidine kinase [Oscillospiraceae bacterium]
MDAYATKLSAQLDGSSIYRILFSLNLRYHFAVAVAIPMDDGGMFLFLKELPDANRIFFSLVLAITLLSLLCMAGLLFSLRSSRKLEKLRREYVDNINHELKSPISAVRSLTEPLQDGMVRDQETLHRYSEIILSEISALEHTVQNMLELSRLQHQLGRVETSSLSAQDVFQDTASKYAVLCDEFGLSFSLSPALHVCPVLRTNRDLAARLLEILLDNAVKFTPPQGHIRVCMAERGGCLIVSVGNNGPAISPADQKRIFERFYQSSKGHDQRGSGLGLAIAMEIADCLHEKLWLERSSSDETVFSFTVKTSGATGLASRWRAFFHRLHRKTPTKASDSSVKKARNSPV